MLERGLFACMHSIFITSTFTVTFYFCTFDVHFGSSRQVQFIPLLSSNLDDVLF